MRPEPSRSAAASPSRSLDWDDLRRELDLWAAQGRRIDLWWRDDDAAEPTSALTRLLNLAEPYPLALAVVPAVAAEPLAEALRDRPGVAVIQHGFAHRNHAPVGRPAVECGGERPVERVLGELAEGFRKLRLLFGSRFEPILAPPWNRIEAIVVARLAQAGYRGLSAFGPRPRRALEPGLVVANTHFDPLIWRGGVRFAGRGKALSGLIGELAARRIGAVDSSEPLGLLTHHRDNDAAAWEFLAELLDFTSIHPGARWIGVDQAFALDLDLSANAAR